MGSTGSSTAQIKSGADSCSAPVASSSSCRAQSVISNQLWAKPCWCWGLSYLHWGIEVGGGYKNVNLHISLFQRALPGWMCLHLHVSVPSVCRVGWMALPAAKECSRLRLQRDLTALPASGLCRFLRSWGGNMWEINWIFIHKTTTPHNKQGAH